MLTVTLVCLTLAMSDGDSGRCLTAARAATALAAARAAAGLCGRSVAAAGALATAAVALSRSDGPEDRILGATLAEHLRSLPKARPGTIDCAAARAAGSGVQIEADEAS